VIGIFHSADDEKKLVFLNQLAPCAVVLRNRRVGGIGDGGRLWILFGSLNAMRPTRWYVLTKEGVCPATGLVRDRPRRYESGGIVLCNDPASTSNAGATYL